LNLFNSNFILLCLGLSIGFSSALNAAPAAKAPSTAKPASTSVSQPFGVSPSKESSQSKENLQRQQEALRMVSSSSGSIGGRGPGWVRGGADERTEILQYGKTFERHELTGSSSTYMGVIDFTSKDPHENNLDTASQGACRSPIPLNRFASQNRAAPNKDPKGSGEDKPTFKMLPVGKAPPAIPEKLKKALMNADPKRTAPVGMGVIKK
jgi:hypothetical protein